jgi:phosphohistidine phosphatase SixA
MLPDKRRPLAAKGRRRAMRCATRLDERAWTPDLILTSDATRCLETLEAMGDAVEAFRTAPVILVPDFYDKTHGDEVSQAKSAKVIGKRVGVEVGLGGDATENSDVRRPQFRIRARRALVLQERER